MKNEIKEKIIAKNQKYLSKLVDKDIPERLEKQLETMDWSYFDLINDKEQKRGEFSPLGAMELPEIEEKKADFYAKGIEAIKACKVGAILLAGGQGT